MKPEDVLTEAVPGHLTPGGRQSGTIVEQQPPSGGGRSAATTKPPDRQPGLELKAYTLPVGVGIPITLQGSYDVGLTWEWVDNPHSPTGGVWVGEPILSGTVTVTVDTGEQCTLTVGSTDFTGTLTFGHDGPHVVTASIDSLTNSTTVTATTLDVGPVHIPTTYVLSGDPTTGVPVAVRPQPPLFTTVTAQCDGGEASPLGCDDGVTWAGTVSVRMNPLGTRVVTVTAKVDGTNVSVSKDANFVGTDGTPPGVTWPDSVVQSPGGSVAIQGTATDSQSGMRGGQAGVALRVLPGGPDAVMTPSPTQDWSTWTALFTPTTVGATSLAITATDGAGNAATVSAEVNVASSYVPLSLEDRLSPLEYLRAVMYFANDFVSSTSSASTGVSAADLSAALSQPLGKLSEPLTPEAALAVTPLNELRVPVELLRAHIAANQLSTTPGAGRENAYRLAAYEALLVGAGTSYDEMRLARGAVDGDRAALAARIGVPLYGSGAAGARNDQLDMLLLAPDAVTEDALEQLFGLRATTSADPLRVVVPSKFGRWRTEAQRTGWQRQDTNPMVPLAYRALVDPDVITEADIVATHPAAPVITGMLTSRRSDLIRQAALVQQAISGATDAATKLTAAVIAGIPGASATFLADVTAAEEAGTNIDAPLTGAGLDRVGFTFLSRLRSLAGTGLITEQEWVTVVDVLVGCYRRRSYPQWAAGETAVLLSPDLFQNGGDGPQLTSFRIDRRARTDWAATLAIRTTQAQDLLDGLADLIRGAEQAALPILRDALLADVAPSVSGDAGERMSDRYGVDMKASGTLQTTRLAQTTASLQALLELVRSGDVSTDSPAHGWVLRPDAAGEPTFDQAWNVTGNYISWRQAVTAYLFNEQHMDPSLLDPATNPAAQQSEAYKDLSTTLRSTLDLQPAAATDAMKTYAGKVQGNSGLTENLWWLSNRDRAWQRTLNAACASIGATAWAREIYWAAPMSVAQRLRAAGEYQAALDWLWPVFPWNDPNAASGSSRITNEITTQPTPPTIHFDKGWTSRRNPFALADGRPAPYLRATLLEIIGCMVDYGDAEFTSEDDESVAHARALYRTAAGLLDHPRLAPVPVNTDSPGEAAFPIPLLAVLRDRVINQLAKIRQGRNIAGLPRQSVSLTGASGLVRQPTPYHYKTLLGRAQQLTQQASQMEATYLSLLEKYDHGVLTLQEAGAALKVTNLQEQVSIDQTQEATDAKAVADAQTDKATATIDQYRQAIAAPMNKYETALLGQYKTMRDLQDVVAGADAAIEIARTVNDNANFFKILGSAFTNLGSSSIAIAGMGVKAAAQIMANNVQSQMQANQLQSNLEDRREDWARQQAIAEQDHAVCVKQQLVAADQVTIALAQGKIATQQTANAQATLNLLQTQFTKPDLYKLMSDIIGGAYRAMLQHATATARLAQEQLAFERAETTRTVIATDYWQTPGALFVAGQDTSRGMTGAERLIRDLSQLDQYAFSTDDRLLNISQTFSLAQLFPVEFIDFRSTGQLTFATPMSLFDGDFPGNYQRFIRQVQVSVVALIPPGRGIRGTLRNNGMSRVTSKQDGGGFTDLVLRRDPSSIAITSPLAATGLFPADPQPELLLPFEGIGVDTTWEFELPAAANPFDFTSLSDVLITVDYTARTDPDYATQVIKTLNAHRTRGADCAFSLARDFPDNWYALSNPPAHQAPTTTVLLRDLDFPINIRELSTANVALRVISSTPLDPVIATLTRTVAVRDPSGTVTYITVGGPAQIGPDGIASTRRGAANWPTLLGPTPAGSWTLGFDTTFTNLVTQGQVDDVVLIVSWTGQSALWNN